jgi:tungstate transport system substrate-binding protein
MKKYLMFCCTCLMLLGLIACTAKTPPAAKIENPVIRLSTTTSVNDSGLLPYLQPHFEADTGYKIEITSAGTGAAIEKARTGDADCLLVHAKSSEEDFIGEGFGEERLPFMFNYFVIVGPEADPAGIKDATTAAEAFAAIANSGSKFVSRGDESGTHVKENNIWKDAGIDPTEEDWYISVGAGMGQTLAVADEEMAYTLSDKATFLAHDNNLKLLKEEAEDMKNTYSLIAITPERWEDTNYAGALAFIEWMTSPKALDLIDAYGVAEYGEPLFFSMR